MSICGGTGREQRREPLTILFKSSVTSTATVPAHPRPVNPVTPPPWRPFSVHEDPSTNPVTHSAAKTPHPQITTLKPSAEDGCGEGHRSPYLSPLTPAAPNSFSRGYFLLNLSLSTSKSHLSESISQPVLSHHTVPSPAQPFSSPGFLPPFIQVVPDGLCSQLAAEQFHRQRLLGTAGDLVDFAGRQQCIQCTTHADLTRHQSSNCACPSKSLSSSPQSGSTGSPPNRSPSPLLSCPHCDKTYTSSGALKMHVRTHTLPCRCPTCGKAFSRPWLLQGHIRTHTGERPFICAECGRAFADRSNLRAHSQTHSAAKRYQCTSCLRSFSRLSLLLRHERNTTSGCCSATHSIHNDRQK